jgi:Ca-activated chloride channel homolog
MAKLTLRRPANPRALAVTAGFAILLTGTFGLTSLQSWLRAAGPHLVSPGSVVGATGGGQAGCTELLLSMPADDVPVLAPLVAAYDGARHSVSGRCVEVRITPKSAGDAADALARGWNDKVDGPAPDVWLPGASSWLILERARASASGAPVLAGSNPSFAQSPLVIAMPLPMAEALGWPQTPIGFSDLIAIGLDPAGWGKAGHPEWGALRLGKTNPLLSTSGLHALIAAYFASTGVSADLTAADLASPRTLAFVKGVELATVHYGDSTTTFLAGLQRADDAGAGLDYVSAIAVEERQVLAYNQGNPTGDPALRGKHGLPRVPLAAIYPKEGTLISDNPFAALNAGWVSTAQKAAAADLLAFLLAAPQQRTLQDAGYRDAGGRAGASLDQPHGLLADHPQKTIKPPAASVLDKLQASWWQVRKPARILVIIDISGSMDEPVQGTGTTKLGLVKVALTAALDKIGDSDQVGVWTFSNEHQVALPISAVGDSRTQLKQGIGALAAGGGTLLYETVQDGFDYMRAQLDPSHITAVVVLTDGDDNNSRPGALGRLLAAEAAQPAGGTVRVFTIAYGVDANRDILRRIAQASGAGSYDASNPALIREVFNAVLSNF